MCLKSQALEAVKRKKVFTVYGQGSKAVRKALIERGWIEKLPRNRKCWKLRKRTNRSLLSSFLKKYEANFIWGKKSSKKKVPCICEKNIVKKRTGSDIHNKPKICKSPMRNRLKAVNRWNSKLGIFSCQKKSFWYNIDNVAEVIAPRTFSNENKCEKIEFIKDYQLTACTSLLRWIVESLQNNKPIFHEAGRISINVIIFAINQCEDFFYKKEHKDIDCNTSRKVTCKQWISFLKEYRSLVNGKELFQINIVRNVVNLLNCAKYLLDNILTYRPQLNCEGCYNIWIVKPSAYSRGKGIEISSKLDCIMDIITETNKKYVVQKYIGKNNFFNIAKSYIMSIVVTMLKTHYWFVFSEEPLLIYDTKFDIRQYYLVTSTYPLVIWMYKDCYLKFSSKTYSVKKLHKAIHLTNHSVQRHYKNTAHRHPELPKSNMWNLNNYKRYLNKMGKRNVWDKVVYPSMKKVIIGIMLSSQDSLVTSKNRFELFGCDFILDSNFTPWLIEVNHHPDLGATTEVTANMCPEVVTDIIKGIVWEIIIILIEFSIY